MSDNHNSQHKKLSASEERAKVQDKIHEWVLKEGLKSAVIWGAGATAISLAFHKGLGPSSLVTNYARIRPAYKVLPPVLFATGAFFTKTDIAAMEADRAFSLRFSINKEAILSQQSEELDEQNKPFEFTQAGLRNLFFKYKYHIVGGMWLTTVSATLAYNFARTDIKKSQKLINARMTGQAAALLGMCAFGASSAMDHDNRPPLYQDPHFNSIINGDHPRHAQPDAQER